VAIRFQADNDLRLHIVRALRRREPSIDFKTADAAGLDDLDDLTVLRRAAAEDRILVTHDKRTMPRAMAALLAAGEESPGVLLVIPQNVDIPRLCGSLILIWSASMPEEWRNQITKVPF
jgi:predicted nuclease of predicted toxin-antitoxin system